MKDVQVLAAWAEQETLRQQQLINTAVGVTLAAAGVRTVVISPADMAAHGSNFRHIVMATPEGAMVYHSYPREMDDAAFLTHCAAMIGTPATGAFSPDEVARLARLAGHDEAALVWSGIRADYAVPVHLYPELFETTLRDATLRSFGVSIEKQPENCYFPACTESNDHVCCGWVR